MELTDNCFKLIKIRTEGEKAYFTIALLTGERNAAQCYWENYYEGIYIGKGTERYQVYAERTDEIVTGEIYYDSIVQNAVPKQDHIMCLWVRPRMGNTVIDQMVQIGTGEADIIFGHRDVFQLIPVSDYEFYFYDCRNRYRMPVINPIRDIRDIRDISNVRISLSENAFCFTARISTRLLQMMEEERISNELCLAWRDTKTKLIYYFHPETIADGCLTYRLERNELDQMGQLETDGRMFDWIMTDVTGREYGMYAEEECVNEEENHWILPSRDIFARLRKKEDGTFTMQMVTTTFFYYRGADETGNKIILEFRKRTYPVQVTKFLAQRVNTDLIYQLPYRIAAEDEERILYAVELEFDAEEREFRTGIYQFWIVVQDGVAVDQYPLKLYREVPVCGNTYMISEHPYTVIENRYYNCLFYNDTSNNFKCNVQPKVMKIRIDDLHLTEQSEYVLRFTMKKEPFFDWITSVCLETGNGELLQEGFHVIEEDWKEITAEVSISLRELYERGNDLLFRPVLSFQGRRGWMYLENNFYVPAVSGRETKRFSDIKQIGNQEYRRIWGNHIGKSYAIGVSENLRLLTGTSCEIKEGKLAVKAEAASDGKCDISHLKLRLAARNMLTEEVVWFQESSQEEGAAFELPVSKLGFSEYLLYGQFENGMISYLAMSMAASVLYAYADKKKLLVGKTGDAMTVSVTELLIFEDEARSRQCQNIIEKAQADQRRVTGKIWLVGENYGLSARDNGLAFFEYCMKNRNAVDAEVYYVTKRENKDSKALEPYKDHVLIYDSDDHIYYDELAEFYIVSHGIRDVMPSLYHNSVGIYRKPVIYLQHGITAMKIMDINNKSYGGSIRKFIVSSEFEKELLVHSRQFWEDEVMVTGFSRHDKLAVEESDGKYIWVMPTWRDWLIKSERNFRNSLFYRYYSELFRSEKLYQELLKAGQKLVFSLHIEFEKYKHFFDEFENDLIHIADMHERKISDRIRECSMMVTDYSSIIFDAVYLGKPVVFFQFDQAEYHKYRGSYVNLETDLPGEVDHTPTELTDTLIVYLQNGFVFQPEFRKRAEKYFEFHDGRNAERIYKAVIECREEMASER